MFNFLIRKDVRKIFKRKDSDAGERGRALEDLRASLFNELRTSDGAKRQQQRICGPTVALTFNFLVSVGIILVNKLVLGKVGFNYPIFLTFIHYLLSWFLMAILKGLSLLPVSPPSKTTPFTSLLSLGIVMSLSNGLANVSLKYNSMGFYQMAKIAVTPSIVLAEFVFFRKLMWKTTPITLLFLVTLMPWLDPPGILSFNWNRNNTSAILVSAVLGFLLQWSGALALGATSATTHVVLGQFKTCVILLGGFLIFGSNPGITSICGATAALAGMSVYTYLNLLNSQQQPTKTSPRQASFSLTKSKLSKENSEPHDGKCNGEYV
ncbi:hypothetical protein MKX01_016906 [Papaver californicum]|nr:hypothetical protein MKX01_016906 [Papaver californicum]